MIKRGLERGKAGSAFLTGALFAVAIAAGSSVIFSSEAHARYTGTGPACVSGVASNDRLNVRTGPSARTRIVGSFAPGQCGFDIISVQGSWTYLRGSDRGFQISGWVNNRFLRSRAAVVLVDTQPASPVLHPTMC